MLFFLITFKLFVQMEKKMEAIADKANIYIS